MSKAKFIQENGETILPITHEEAVLDNDGKNLPSKYQQKQDENLLTDAKTIVGAINELSTKGGSGGGEGTITSVPYTEGSDLDIEQIGGGSVGEITTDEVKLPNSDVTLSEELDNYTTWIQNLEGLSQSTEDWLQDVNDVAYDNKGIIGETELATNDKTLTGAINELFQSANNGKELIANAIGEPLNAEDTFSAMSGDINGLLAKFKTNMMNNGIAVESGDKFKALIDKIATLADSEGKGTQFMVGSITIPTLGDDYYTYTKTYTTTLDLGLEFKPSTVYILDYNYLAFYDYYNGGKSSNTINISNTNQSASLGWGDFTSIVIDDNGVVTLTIGCTTSGYGVHANEQTCEFIAIGVGEEDTTLRDSLASILQEEGVEVTEDDDMASLISKVDQKFDESGDSLDIISATELPATGKEGQICVITDTPVDSFILTSDLTVTPSNNIVLYMSNDFMNYTKMMGNTRLYINIAKAQQSNSFNLDVYKWSNSSWYQLCVSTFIILSGGQVPSSSAGSIPIGSYWNYHESTGTIYCPSSSTYSYYTYYNERLNFDIYNTIKFTAYTGTTNAKTLYFGISTVTRVEGRSSNLSTLQGYCTATVDQSISSTTPTTFTLDISSFSGSGYLMFFTGISISQIFIKDIELY